MSFGRKAQPLAKARTRAAAGSETARQRFRNIRRRTSEFGDQREQGAAAAEPTRTPDRASTTAPSRDLSRVPVFPMDRDRAAPTPAARQPANTPGQEAVHDTLHSPGQPLDASTRQFFEPRFGVDFGRVRVHTDAPAGRAAKAVGAQAFAVGERIVFAAGRYRPAAPEGLRLIAHELTHVVQQSGTRMPWIQRQPETASGEIEMTGEDLNKEAATPALIKSRQAPTELIRDVSSGKTMNEQQWTENLGNTAKVYADLAKTAQVDKVFQGPAAVAKVADEINVIASQADAHKFLPGLNFSPFILDRGETGYVSAEGGDLLQKLDPAPDGPLPKIAIVLGSKAFASGKQHALGVLRHELIHAEHLNLALKQAENWQADTRARKTGFQDWLGKNRERKESALNVTLAEEAAKGGAANTELLAYAEEFMTLFALTRPPPADNDDPSFLPLFGALSSSSEPWANATISVRSQALGRLQEFYCHALDAKQQAAFDRFAAKMPTKQTSGAKWDWLPTRQMHQHFFDGLNKIVAAKCAGLGKRGSK